MILAALQEELGCWLQRGGLRRAVRTFFVYLLPALFVQLFLTQLSGSALLLPESWRGLVILVSVLLGQACFNLARSDPRLMQHPRDGEEEGDVQPPEARATGKRARHEVRRDSKRELRRRDRTHRRNRSVLPWLAAGVLLLVVQVGLRVRCVVPFNIPHQVAKSTDTTPDDLPYYFALDPPWGDAGVVLADGPRRDLSGTLLYPLWIGNALTRDLIDSVEQAYGVRWTEHYMNIDPEQVVEALKKERLSMAVTICAFALVHLGLVVTLSTAYGRMFSVPEETGAKLCELVT
ncbi:MAG TPA: hypothetical protein VMT18_07420 [Planctomycetota bacterium]|nr:hypothetical protein [Planctomycetota bacterium]